MPAKTWIDLKGIILSEKKFSKTICYMIQFLKCSHKEKNITEMKS